MDAINRKLLWTQHLPLFVSIKTVFSCGTHFWSGILCPSQLTSEMFFVKRRRYSSEANDVPCKPRELPKMVDRSFQSHRLPLEHGQSGCPLLLFLVLKTFMLIPIHYPFWTTLLQSTLSIRALNMPYRSTHRFARRIKPGSENIRPYSRCVLFRDGSISSIMERPRRDRTSQLWWDQLQR